jgi:hypothetical protein
MDLGRLEPALNSFDKALQFKPDYQLARDAREEVLKRLKNTSP